MSDLSSDPRDPLTRSIGFQPGPGQVWGAEPRDTAPISPSYPGQQSTGRSSPGSAGLSAALHRPAWGGKQGWHDAPAGLRPGSQGHGFQVAGTVPEKRNLRPRPSRQAWRRQLTGGACPRTQRGRSYGVSHSTRGSGKGAPGTSHPGGRCAEAWGRGLGWGPGPCVGLGEGRGEGGQAQWAERVAGGAHGEGQPPGGQSDFYLQHMRSRCHHLGLGAPSLSVGRHPGGDPASAPPSRGPWCLSWWRGRAVQPGWRAASLGSSPLVTGASTSSVMTTSLHTSPLFLEGRKAWFRPAAPNSSSCGSPGSDAELASPCLPRVRVGTRRIDFRVSGSRLPTSHCREQHVDHFSWARKLEAVNPDGTL